MSVYDRILELCKSRGMGTTALEVALGFSNGSIGKLKHARNLSAERARIIADFFGVSVEYILTGQHPEQTSDSGKAYYFSDETAATAQWIYENKDLRLLFDAARDADPADLKVVHDMLLALKRKERGSDDPD